MPLPHTAIGISLYDQRVTFAQTVALGRNRAILPRMDESLLILLLSAVGFCIVFPLFWAFNIWLASLMGGWRKVARAYPYQEPLSPNCLNWQSGNMRFGTRYNIVLKLCADDLGLYPSLFFLFRPGHPPFFVPWEEIRAVEKSYFLNRMVELRFERTPEIPFRLFKDGADKLVNISDGRFTYEKKQ